ncbi:MAG: cytochrome C oxidase subunit IV family protein [Planctomycetes bacterium]|nr:cytochrome C oxidase subunit IV family protein [Planctomycetota bacterium]
MSSSHHGTGVDLPTGQEEELAHVASPKVLIATFLALIFLTIVTVAVASVGLGEWDFIFAMVIATIKVLLVCMFFMHLWYDKPFHALVFVSGVAFALLFIALAYMDTAQYQSSIQWEDKKPLPEASQEGHDH